MVVTSVAGASIQFKYWTDDCKTGVPSCTLILYPVQLCTICCGDEQKRRKDHRKFCFSRAPNIKSFSGFSENCKLSGPMRDLPKY